jgi:hypothetical protein
MAWTTVLEGTADETQRQGAVNGELRIAELRMENKE